MEIVTALAKLLLLPPFGFFVLIVVGWLVMRRHRRLGRALFAAGLVALYLFSTPHIGSSLLRGLQVDQPLPLNPSVQDVGAIVVLGADVRRQPPEFGGDTVGALTLERIRYGAKLHRELGLPLLVTGGATRPQEYPVGLAMRESLEQDFVVPVRWAETEAVNTYENARLSSDILTSMGITKIYLVTHAWHMPRARMAFEAVGLKVVPAPTGFVTRPTPEFGDFIATASGLLMSYYAFYEAVGYIWYSIRYTA